jgi:preprotein translocase subunit SecE
MPMANLKPITFLKEVRSELKRVTWPTKKEAIRLTSVVIAVSIVVGIYIGVLDYLFTKIMELLLKI